MITKIEISNFKTFNEFELDLSPFSAIAGLNAVGKSNLFDALQLLSDLAEKDIRSAFSAQRGEANELFSQNHTGEFSKDMNFAVEMLLDKTVKDRWGGEQTLKYTRLRYEITIKREKDYRNIDRLYVSRESLTQIQKGTDSWYRTFIKKENDYWRPATTGGRVPFISTTDDASTQITTINLHQDSGSRGRPRPAHDLESTILSSVTNTEFPHALAVRNEMLNWQFLQLNPNALRKPSAQLTSRTSMGSDGTDLAATLHQMQTEDTNVLKHISRDMAKFVSDVTEVAVREDTIEKRYVLWVKTNDGNWFSSQVLSEGTLRLLALCVLKYDQRHSGLICFEEPENGINPTRMQPLLKLLVSMATDFSDEHAPLRQILVNTHSPLFIQSLESLIRTNFEQSHHIALFLARLNQKISRKENFKITKISQVDFNNLLPFPLNHALETERKVTAEQLKNYLNTAIK